jgi:hypothetical protein
MFVKETFLNDHPDQSNIDVMHATRISNQVQLWVAIAELI